MPEPPRNSILSVPFNVVVDLIGRKAMDSLHYIAELTSFTFGTFFSSHTRGPTRQSVATQIIFSGVDALPAITLVSVAIALSVTAQFILLLQSFTTEKEVIQITTRIIAEEFSPLLTAIILIGRSGSAITVDLGNMRLNHEIRGLELLGINIRDFFALPRMIGLALSQLTLAVYFSGTVMVGGIIFTALIDSPSNYKYLFILLDALTPYHLVIFLIKNLLFGLMIGAIACFHGMRVHYSITELPQQTQQAIVNSLVLVFILDGFIAIAT